MTEFKYGHYATPIMEVGKYHLLLTSPKKKKK